MRWIWTILLLTAAALGQNQYTADYILLHATGTDPNSNLAFGELPRFGLAPAASPPGAAVMYFDTGSTCLKVSNNGGAYACVGGSGSGTVSANNTAAGAVANYAAAGGSTTVGPTTLNYVAPTLTVSTAAGGNGVLALSGNTSGTATFTAPAVAGTTSNPIASSNILTVPNTGTTCIPSYTFAGQTGSGLANFNGTGLIGLCNSTTSWMQVNSNQVTIPNGGGFGAVSASTFGSGPATLLTALVNGLWTVDTTTSGNELGMTKGGQSIAVSGADVTCGTGGTLAPCTSLTTITGLSKALPLSAQNWSFTCDLYVSQATAAAADQIGIQTATNGAINITAFAEAYTAAAVVANAGISDVASTTTAQSVITFTPGAAGTKVPIHLSGTLEGVSASGTTFNVMILTGAAADLLTVFRGSSCYIY